MPGFAATENQRTQTIQDLAKISASNGPPFDRDKHSGLDLTFLTQGRLRPIGRLYTLGFPQRVLQMAPRLSEMLGRFVLPQNETLPRGIADFVLHLMKRLQPLWNAVEQIICAHELSEHVALRCLRSPPRRRSVDRTTTPKAGVGSPR